MSLRSTRSLRIGVRLLLGGVCLAVAGWDSSSWGQVHYELGSEEEIPTPLTPPAQVPAEGLLPDEIVIEPPVGEGDVTELTPEEIQALTDEPSPITPLPFSYRSRINDWSWVAAGQFGFGMFSMRDTGYLESDERTGLNFGVGLHFLEGTMSPDLHPRLWDFTLGYQVRGGLGFGIDYDVAFNVGIFSDFEDSARDGVRFPSHAVLTGYLAPTLKWVLGVDYVDRDDYTVLPVAGVRWQMTERLKLNIEIPEPEVSWRYGDENLVYFAGRLGGGTWDIEYVGAGNDVMTYRQWEIVVGLADVSENKRTSWEFGYLFDRALEFRSGRSDMSLHDVWMFRLVTRH